jgi:hypothetical protein
MHGISQGPYNWKSNWLFNHLRLGKPLGKPKELDPNFPPPPPPRPKFKSPEPIAKQHLPFSKF